MRSNAVQPGGAVSFASGASDEAAQQILKIDVGHACCKRLPAWFFAGPRVVDLWPPDARPVWARAKSTKAAPPQFVGSPADALVDTQAWTQAMRQNTRLWVRKFGVTLGQVQYFQQLQQHMAERLPQDLRHALEGLLPTPDGALLFNVLPQLALRTLGHTPLPPDARAVDLLFANGSAMLVWPVLLVAPSCCDALLMEAVQRALSPAALQRLEAFCASPIGGALLRLLRERAEDPMVMAADMTVRNNLQAGLRDELQGIYRDCTITRLREMGERLQGDVVNMRNVLASKQDLFLQAASELDRTLIALEEVAALASELRLGPGAGEAGDMAWEVAALERVQQCVPRMHASLGDLFGVVGLSSAAGQTLALLYRPLPL